jgi:ParB/RepB/Spo0J family partition protein
MSDTDDTDGGLDPGADMSGVEAERKLIDFSRLDPDPCQPRGRPKMDEAFWGLVESIKKDGMLTDLLVRKAEDTDMRDYSGSDTDYLVLAGTRRLLALHQTDNYGMKVPCKVIEADDEEATRIALGDNTHREDLSDYEFATAVAQWYNQLAERLVPEDGEVECPECGEEYNGRQGLKTHIQRSDDHERSEEFSDLFLSTREVYEAIAYELYGETGNWRTVENIHRVSQLPDTAINLIKTDFERAGSSTGWEKHVPPDQIPESRGDGPHTSLVKLAELDSASEIESDGTRATLLLRAYGQHIDEGNPQTISKIRERLIGWQEAGEKPYKAFNNALTGKTPPEPEPEPEPEPDDEEEAEEVEDEDQGDGGTADETTPESPDGTLADDETETSTETTGGSSGGGGGRSSGSARSGGIDATWGMQAATTNEEIHGPYYGEEETDDEDEENRSPPQRRPIYFPVDTVREQLIEEGAVIMARHSTETTGRRPWTTGGDQPEEEGTVYVASFGEVKLTDAGALAEFVDLSGYDSVEEWQAALRPSDEDEDERGPYGFVYLATEYMSEKPL